MSASLDDMPAYEHFQDELDFELAQYAKINAISDLHCENEFIQFICFSIFLSKPSELTIEILEHFFKENPESTSVVKSFIKYINSSPVSRLRNSFSQELYFH